MKKINEVSALAGVSKRTLQYYDDEGLLPVNRTENNERLYDEEALFRLWQILLYKGLDLKLEEIKEILDMSADERRKVLVAHILAMKLEENNLATKIRFAEKLQEEDPETLFKTISDEESKLTYKKQVEKLREIYGKE